MTFSDALHALKLRHRVSRRGWNGRGMWLYLVDPATTTTPIAEGLRLLPWIGMKTADGGFVPWLASQTDLLANDWSLTP